MPHGVHAVMRDPGGPEDVRPLLPVGLRIDRAAVLLSEDNIVVLPKIFGVGAFRFLGGFVGTKDGDELGRQRDCLAAPFFDLPEDEAAAMSVGAGRCMTGAVGWA